MLATLPHLNRLDIDPIGPVRRDLVRSRRRRSRTAASPASAASRTSPSSRSRPAPRRRSTSPSGSARATSQFDRRRQPRLRDHAGRRVGDRSRRTRPTHEPTIVPPIAVADPAISPDDLEVQIVVDRRVRGGPPGRTRRRCASSAVGHRTRARRGRSRSRRRRPTSISHPTARASTPSSATRRSSRSSTSPATRSNPTGVETIDLADGDDRLARAVAPTARARLLYTNATLDERITMIELDQPGFPHVTWPLKKSVRAVAISPTGDSAIVLNAKAPGDPATATTVDDYIDESYGYTLRRSRERVRASCRSRRSIRAPFAYAPDGSEGVRRARRRRRRRPRRARCRSSRRRPASSITKRSARRRRRSASCPARPGVRRAAPPARPHLVRRARDRCGAHRHRLRPQQPRRGLRTDHAHPSSSAARARRSPPAGTTTRPDRVGSRRAPCSARSRSRRRSRTSTRRSIA